VPDYKINSTITTFGPFAVTAMDLLDILNHLLNFVASALTVGIGLVLVSRLFMKKVTVRHSLLAQAAINSIAGIAALAIGLWLFGRDGKMASYAAMVLAAATSQWVLLKSWKPSAPSRG
jgi:hypothetical protein